MLYDLSLALRRLRNAPAFTAIAIITLAFAIGANTAVFTVADTVLLKPLPYLDPGEVYVLGTVDGKTGERSRAVSTAHLQAIESRSRGVSEVGLRGPTSMTIHRGGDQAEWMETFAVAPSYFRVLGVRPMRGRLFETRDGDEPGRVAVLIYETWKRRFGGDERIIGRTVMLGTQTREVIGVLPAGFVFPTTSLRFLYNPTGRPEYLTATVPPWQTGAPQSPPRGFEEAVVRLEPGVTREQAQAEIDALVAATASNQKDRVVLESARAVLFPTGRPIMVLLVAAAALVLLLGCANLANLLLARTRRREREIGLQAALGATRARIVRPILFVTLVVGIAAAVLALVVTRLTFDFLLQQVPPAAYGSAFIRFNARVGVFALSLGALSGVVFAAIPAWRSARLDVQELLQRRQRRNRHRRSSLGQPLTALQVALAVVLVFGAIGAMRAFVSVLRVPLGFSPEGLIAINVRPNPGQPSALRDFYARAVGTLANRADVAAAGAGSSVPPDGFGAADSVITPDAQRSAEMLNVLPGYFEAIGVPIVRGRSFTWDDLNSDSAVLSASAARALFADQPAIGTAIRSRQGRVLTVVGIVGDVTRSFSRAMAPPVYVVPARDMTSGMTLVARVHTRGASSLEEIRREIAAIVPATPVTVVWWADTINGMAAYRTPRFQTVVLGTFAALALVLTSLGLFAAVAFSVAARTREMGIRLALGAQPRRLVRMVIRHALLPVVTGLVAGLLATQWFAGLAEATLFGVDMRSVELLVLAAVTVAVSALIGAYLPARRAAGVDPVAALRAE
jgi:putative ABC transport system permease protein